jgi:hypothetical protein
MPDESRVVSRYHPPDTSDKRDDESYLEYWDRRRAEMHGPDCDCVVCRLAAWGIGDEGL